MDTQREIKFRAWDKINKIWIKDFLITPEQDVLIIGEYETIKSGLTNGWKSSDGNVELQQFTGLKDKNGKEIYEGDILEFSDKAEWYRNELFLKTREKQVEILNDNVKYPKERRIVSLDWDSRYYEWLYPCEDLDSYWEIIGNIYET